MRKAESVWGILKRWARAKCGGKLPHTNDRDAWRALITEFQFRKHASAGHSLDGGNTFVVPVPVFLQTLAKHFSA